MDDPERDYWNAWNSEHREDGRGDVSLRQAEVVLDWLSDDRQLRLLDAGCGTGWMSQALTAHGSVVGTDLADEVVARAAERVPSATFVAGDGNERGIRRPVRRGGLTRSLVPRGGSACVRGPPPKRTGRRRTAHPRNAEPPVLERFNWIAPPGPGQRRKWVSRTELTELLTDVGFRIDVMRTLSPKADRGLMRYVAKLGRVLHLSTLLERFGFGWTIMVRATRV